MPRTGSTAVVTAAAAIAASALALAAEEPKSISVQGAAPASAAEPSQKASGRGGAAAEKAMEVVDLAKLRLREGTRLRDIAGRFRQSGDTLTFIDGENREITGLPNLNLERILRMLKTVEEPESISWSVSGTVTEFGARNYLLISRAVFKAAAPPPAPENLLQAEGAAAR
jgi:hypothetical protein